MMPTAPTIGPKGSAAMPFTHKGSGTMMLKSVGHVKHPNVVPCAVAHRAHRRRRDPRFPGVYHQQPATLLPSQDEDQQTSSSTALPANQLPSALFFADFSTRVALERLYQLRSSGAGEARHDCLDDIVQHQQPLAVTTDEKPQRTRNAERTPDYFANVGDAIRTLREDIPELFNRELNYSIYRDDIVFKDPRNNFKGIKNYKLIFWSLRFHGKIFFSKLYVEVKRIWQPQDDVIKMRWTVHGVPRVPWEAEGLFDGISSYKLDNSGKVYEHCVDNVLLRDPPMLTNPPLLAGLNLVPGAQQQPYPGAWGSGISVPTYCPSMDLDDYLVSQQPAVTTAPSTSGHASNGKSVATMHRLSSNNQLDLSDDTTATALLHDGSHVPAIVVATPLSPVRWQEVTGSIASSTQSNSRDEAQISGLPTQQSNTPVESPEQQASAWARFSWVRLYAALWASVCLFGNMRGLGFLDAPPMEPSPS